MKCERCDEKAFFRITDIADDGTVGESHLCLKHLNKHLAAEPATLAGGGEDGDVDGGELVSASASVPCPQCGASFADFRESGRLGCPHDYRAFDAELRPLVESVHGAQSHQGKSPRRAPAVANRATESGKLRRELREAIAREDYEAAAACRDRLDQLERAGSPAE